MTLCALSGMAAGAACPVRTHEFLPSSDTPHVCQWHHASDRGLVTVWPSEYREWAQAHGQDGPMTQMTSPMAIAAIADRTRSPKTAGALAIRMPLEGAVYLIDPTLRPDFQTLPLRSRGATGRAEWFVDDAPVGVSLGDSPVAWPLARGAHTIQVRDADGRSASTRIIVK